MSSAHGCEHGRLSLYIQRGGIGMNWREFIDSDAAVLSGKPVVRGTRLSVEFIMDLFSNGWTREQVINNYPGLSEDSLNAVFSFVSETIHDESVYFFKRNAA